MKPSRSEYHDIRGLRYHVRTWGDSDAPRIFLLHGWMDVSASFQFLVDAFRREWRVIAPDWRGFGLSAWARDGYWFPDYYADLDALLDLYQPGTPANLVGHSMGGVIACAYAGVRPQRAARVISLEGFGLARASPEQAPARYAQWLKELADPPRFRPYRSFADVARRLKRNNPRISDPQAEFLAAHWARRLDSGEVVLASDPRHKIVNPYLFRIEEAIACWRDVTAPVLWVSARESDAWRWHKDDPAQLAGRKGAFRNYSETTLADCGHMMHLDQPERLAGIIEDFLTA